ncbi:protein AHNAK2 [Suncus etruscus]|uniref:protein AHNAK2 n=1 Tax=Suncus etruscus TaxID=109475 RepID=UPI00210FE622|nr:protein AHNAK2 [Suncus etruscus]
MVKASIDKASSRRLQPEELDPKTEEHSVTEGPSAEIIRPRPQGSSPVYECAAESAGLGLLEEERGRPTSGSWRTWWKRDSADSRMTGTEFFLQECVKTTLKTKVEAGASGYSVAGGGQQGLFVQQVLQDSTAAKLFSLREGDQLLSATIFFDDIRYEDALKILQYSEPYKVQFCIQRKLDKQPPLNSTEAWRGSRSSHGTMGGQKGKADTHLHLCQEQDVTESLMDTPTKTLEGEGDQERLITKPRTGRGRRAQRERLSWPKFQTIKTKGRSGPRRSHSSSEAYERTEGNISPTSTDTEEQHPKDTQEMKADLGSRRRKMCINLGFRKLSGKGGPSLWPGRRESKEDDIMVGELSAQLLSMDVDVKPGHVAFNIPEGQVPKPKIQDIKDGGGFKGHLSKVKTPSFKMPKIDMKAPKLDMKGPKTEFSNPNMEMTLPCAYMDLKAPETNMEADINLGDKQVATHDSEFKMPKFIMPSFGVSAESKSIEDSGQGDLDISITKAREDVSLPSAQSNIKASEQRVQISAMDEDIKLGHAAIKVAKGQTTKLHDIEMEGGLKGQLHKVETDSFKMPKVDLKTPQMEIKATGLDIKDTNRNLSSPSMEVMLPTLDMDLKVPEAKQEADIGLGDKEMSAHDSKFKMPKFKMPSFGESAAGKSTKVSFHGDLEVSQEALSLPSTKSDIKDSELSLHLPNVQVDVKPSKVAVKLPDGKTPEPEVPDVHMGGGLKDHLPDVKTHSFKMPKVDLKGPHVDIKGPKLDVKGPKAELSSPSVDLTLPSADVDLQAPEASLEADISLKDKDMTSRDSKFKMPKFKMPSYGGSATSKSMEASGQCDLEVSIPKVQADISLPSAKGDIKEGELSLQLPSVDVKVKPGQVDIKLPEGQIPEPEVPDIHVGGGLKGHLPQVKTPSFKMPKVDLKGPHVDIKGPKIDVKGPKAELSSPSVDLTLPSADVDLQAPEVSLEADIGLKDKDMTSRDSKFKMPKFKMPSFGGSATSKSMEASGQCDLEVSIPKVQADVSLPSAKGDIKDGELSLHLPSVDVEVKPGQVDMKLPEGQIPEPKVPDIHVGGGLKGHLPQVKTPSFKMPKVDLKGPHVDIKGPKLDVKGPKAELSSPSVDLTLPSADVDLQAPEVSLEADISLKDKDMTSLDSKFKMPKFKMPSFGGSATSKSMEASGQCDLEVSIPKVQADISLPSAKGDIKDGELSLQLPSVDVEVKPGQVDIKLPEAQMPEPEVPDIHVGGGLKGHLPQVKTPSFKMPKVDLKGPHVDIKGPKLDVKGLKAELSSPSMEVTLPHMDVDLQAPEASLDADIGLKDKDMTSRDSKFKMPKFKMPSFGGSATSKSMEASGQCDLEVSIPKVQADISLPSAKGDIKDGELSLHLPSVDVEVKPGQVAMKLPEGQMPEPEVPDIHVGGGLKGHLPQVKTPSFKMPKVDLKGPHVDIKGTKLDVKGPKAELSSPSVDLTLPSADVDMQAPEASLEADIGLKDKDMTSRESKFKMPKFKMPSFGSSATSKSMEASGQCDLEVSIPKVQADISLPSAKGDIKDGELSLHLPSVDVEVKPGQVAMKLPEGQMPEPEVLDIHVGGGLKGHLPHVKTPSFKMPKVDLKGPHVDIKGPKLDVKGPKAELSSPSVDLTLPSADVDLQAPEVSLEADIGLRNKEVTSRDSKFKMPKFKMPSFGSSATSKSMESSGPCDLEVTVPKVQADISLPSAKGVIKDGELSVQLPSMDIDVKPSHNVSKMPDAPEPEPEFLDHKDGASFKGHLPKVKAPSFKMPKVDLKAPQVDIKAPRVDVKSPKAELSSPSMEVTLPRADMDLQVPEANQEDDIGLGDKEISARDSKFKMPKFKIPSFRRSAEGKSLEASVHGDMDITQMAVSIPFIQGNINASEHSMPLSTMDMYVQPGHGTVNLPVVPAPEPELPDIEAEVNLKSSDAVSKILPVDNPQGDSEDVSYATLEGVLLSPVSSHTEPLAPLLPTFHGPVSFPKFHRPKFQYSAPRTVAAVEVPSGLGDPSMSGYCSSQRLDSSKIPVSAPQLLYSGDSVCGGMEQLPCIEGTLAATVGGLPSEGADRARKGSPLKMPRLKLPSFRWSPKKGAGSKGIPEPHLKDERLSVTVDMGGLQGETQVHILPDDMPPEANGEGNREYTLGNSGLAMPEPTVSPSEVPQGKIVLPPREPHPTLSRTLGTKSGIRDPGITVQHSLSQGNSEACDYTAFPESQPFGKPVICTSEKPLLPSCRPEDAEGPPASSTDGAASRESWFRVPPFRLPGLRRASSKDKGEDAGLKEVPRLQPAASKPKEQAPARPVSQGDLEEVAVSLDSSKRAADMASPNSASYADVLHCHLHSPSPSSGQHHLPTAEPSFLRAGPGESPPLLLTHVSFSEAPGPAAETVKRPGSLSSQSLSTQSPDPSYSWGMGGVWEDSQLKVRFPKLKVPKFTFPAPNSGADVFIPTVGEVWHPENCLLLTLQTENPEIRSATIMKAGAGHCKGQLEDCDSSSASPVSKVKVRIQDNQAESHAVTIHSRILASSAAHAGSEILTTEIVRESETPLSQKASYGFSLLKGRIPEPTLKASVHLEAQNSPRPGVPGTDSQEPFEIISSIREPTDAFEVGSGAQCADSCSDEEPAEILEFPPEDSPGTIMAEHSSPTEKPESRRSSGIFRFWFPNIGFSQSAPEEPRATSGMQGQQAGPVQKQPEARPETGLPGKQEKAGWFRFPKLGFSSPPAEKSQTTKDEAGLAEQSLQEERVTFYDAQESLSPGEEEEKGVTDDTMAVGSDSHRKGMRE